MAKSFSAQMGIRFRKITSDYGKINAYVHDTGMLILAHANEHRDCSTAQGLINAMPQSARKLALINWFATYSPIVVKDDDKWTAKMRKETDKKFVPFDLEAAAANPWFTLAEGMGAEKVYDFAALVKLVERLGKQIEKKIEDGKVPAEDVESAKAIASKVTALRFDRIVPVPANDQPAAKAPAKAA